MAMKQKEHAYFVCPHGYFLESCMIHTNESLGFIHSCSLCVCQCHSVLSRILITLQIDPTRTCAAGKVDVRYLRIHQLHTYTTSDSADSNLRNPPCRLAIKYGFNPLRISFYNPIDWFFREILFISFNPLQTPVQIGSFRCYPEAYSPKGLVGSLY